MLPADESSPMGPIPVGIWRLNQSRSRLLSAKAMTLWILQNDGEELAWVAVETNPERVTQVISWRGRYGGVPAKTAGAAAIEARPPAPRTKAFVPRANSPAWVPSSRSAHSRKAASAWSAKEAKVTTPAGVQHYLEDFDWVSESPHRP